jgi:oligopeptide transport system permease protein
MPYFVYIARLSRASILEALRSDYVRTARAKGLSMSVIMVKHVLKGALLPVVSYLGPACAGIVTGSVVVESIFVVPGLGTFFVRSALNRDYTLTLGIIIVYSTLSLPQFIMNESFLSFLGLGVSAPLASWGSLVSEQGSCIYFSQL